MNGRFDTNAPNVQNIPKVVDKNFGLEGSEALIAGNHLKIVVPLQKEYRIPLDVATYIVEHSEVKNNVRNNFLILPMANRCNHLLRNVRSRQSSTLVSR